MEVEEEKQKKKKPVRLGPNVWVFLGYTLNPELNSGGKNTKTPTLFGSLQEFMRKQIFQL